MDMTLATDKDLHEGATHPRLALYGDFYRQEVSSYGVSIAQFQGLQETNGIRPSGDFYHQEPEMCDQAEDNVMQPHMWTELQRESHMKFDDLHRQGAGKIRFEPLDKPPSAPADLFFEYELTTMRICHTEPYMIGNGLIDLLQSQEDASIIKVSRKKYSIKANVFHDAAMCILKVRMYGEQNGVYAVEFQCRGKSRPAFGQVYQRAQFHLQSLCGLEAFMPSVVIPEEQPSMDLEQGALPSPILDMATCTESAYLQAEAAILLACRARDQNTAEKLCNPDSAHAFRHLLVANELDIIYPTVCALALIAHCSQATLQFIRTILPELVIRADSRELPQLVLGKLTEIISVCNDANSQWH